MGQLSIVTSALMAVAVLTITYGLYRRRHGTSVMVDRLGQQVDLSLDEIMDQERLQGSFFSRALLPSLRNILGKVGRVTPSGNLERLQRDLMLAGNPGNLSLLDFMGIKMVAALALGAGVFLVLMGRQIATMPALLFSLVGGMIGLYLPNFWMRSKKKARQKAVRCALPDALDMLSICVDAGLGFEAALSKVAERWHNELTDQFKRAVAEIRMGVRRADALRHMVDRTEVAEVASFVAVLVQADKLGVGITNVLHTQSDDARRKRRQRAEEEGRKAPIKMLVPLVIFIFPAMFVVILGPAVPRFMTFFGSMG